MKHTTNNVTDTKIEIKTTLDEPELRVAHRKAVAELAPKVKVKGFRTGKVPASVAEKNIDPETLANKAVEHAINDALGEVLEIERITPLDRPEIQITKFVPTQVLEFTTTIEVVPPVKLGDIKKLKVKREPIAISDKDVDEVIERLRRNASEKHESADVIVDSDEAIIDFDGFDEDGEPVKGASGKAFPLQIGSNEFIPGFEEGLLGHKKGDEFDLPLTFPKDYHAESLAGVKVTFKIKVQKVNKVTLPEVDEKFAASIGPFKTVDDLKNDIRQELIARREYDSDEKYKDDLLGALVEKSEVTAPEVLVDDQINALEQEFRQNLMMRGLDFDQYLKDEQLVDRDAWVERDARPIAERRVKSGLVLAEITRQEDLSASDVEIDARRDALITQHNDPKLQEMYKTDAARRDIANRIVTEKALDFLVAANN